MTADDLKAHCLSLPGTHMVVQWMGSQVYKVGDKMFAVYADKFDRVTLKCETPEAAAFLIEIGIAGKAPHLPRGGWVAIGLDAIEPDDLRARLTTSYDTVVASLPKSVREALE